MYLRVGDDWTLHGFDAAEPVIQTRRLIPSGSIVPTLRARVVPVPLRPSAGDASTLRAWQDRVLKRSAVVRRTPDRVLAPAVKSFRGLVSDQDLARFGGGDAGLVEAVRSVASSLEATVAELRESRSTLSEARQQVLGGTALLQRAGELSASLGVDVTWQDLVQNSYREFSRLRGTAQGLAGTSALNLMGGVNFAHIAAVFRDQGLGLDSLQRIMQSAEGVYGDVYRRVSDVCGDAAAYAEGGLRRIIESVMSESGTASMPTWLNATNLQRVGRAATAWVGADSTRDYVRAAGTTLALAGAVIPMPAGAVVSAVGGLVSLVGSLLGDEEPPALASVEVQSCTTRAGRVSWAYNPEAWAALACWVAAKDGAILDSELVKETMRSGVPPQQVLARAGWFATIDRYTGEVMVQEPASGGPTRPAPMRRLLDLMGPEGRLRLLDPDVADQAPQFCRWMGFTPTSGFWGGANALWCTPDQNETTTRFVGGEANEVGSLLRFRAEDGAAPKNVGAELYSSYNFWVTYSQALLVCASCGTVPLGLIKSAGGLRNLISTGVGGFTDRHPIRVFQRTTCGKEQGWYAPCTREGRRIDTYGIQLPNGETTTLAGLQGRIRDDRWRLENRIPDPSPDPTEVPGASVVRWRKAPLKLPPGFEIRRPRSKSDRAVPGREWGVPAKLGLMTFLGVAGGWGFELTMERMRRVR